jgi:hypothetical protein
LNPQGPVARNHDLVISELPDEVLVYDLRSHKAHCLNASAAAVWRLCDGRHASEIGSELEKLFGSPVTDDFISLAVDQLAERELLEAEITVELTKRTRRTMIKTLGLSSAVALPVIASLVAPRSAMGSASCHCVSQAICQEPSYAACGKNCNPIGECVP